MSDPDIHIDRRVRITDHAFPIFIGMQGRVVERDRRLPFSRVELDKLPIGCSSRTFWWLHATEQDLIDAVRLLRIRTIKDRIEKIVLGAQWGGAAPNPCMLPLLQQQLREAEHAWTAQ